MRAARVGRIKVIINQDVEDLAANGQRPKTFLEKLGGISAEEKSDHVEIVVGVAAVGFTEPQKDRAAMVAMK